MKSTTQTPRDLHIVLFNLPGMPLSQGDEIDLVIKQGLIKNVNCSNH